MSDRKIGDGGGVLRHKASFFVTIPHPSLFLPPPPPHQTICPKSAGVM